MGRRQAIDELEQMTFPTDLLYLWMWYQQILWGLGRDSNGSLTLTWQDVNEWSIAMKSNAKPHEKEALVILHGLIQQEQRRLAKEKTKTKTPEP